MIFHLFDRRVVVCPNGCLKLSQIHPWNTFPCWHTSVSLWALRLISWMIIEQGPYTWVQIRCSFPFRAKDISSSLTSNIRRSYWSPLPSLCSTKSRNCQKIFKRRGERGEGRGGGGHQKLERVQSLHTIFIFQKISGQQQKLHAGSTDPWMFQKFWNVVEILEILVEILDLVEIPEFGQHFRIWSKFWNLVKILKFGKNSEIW